MAKKELTEQEIAQKCPTCDQGKWVHGTHICLRKKCKYLTTKKSRYWVGKEGV